MQIWHNTRLSVYPSLTLCCSQVTISMNEFACVMNSSVIIQNYASFWMKFIKKDEQCVNASRSIGPLLFDFGVKFLTKSLSFNEMVGNGFLLTANNYSV